ncbi:protein kinase [Streptomyces sp. NPDC053431]|uniref:serine/threonine-protein kinase n=1 Tax=Streptomyces sp. NPDC053431 TaxID=3365703 RepID=UPI0037D1763B
MQPLAADDPRQVGEYRLLRQLGAGGMGRVYLGRTAGGRTVAVKVVRRELAEDSEFRARFRQEVAAARRVGGAWTAPVLDADTEGGHPWVATGYVAGPALTAAVRDFGPLPETAVRTLGVGLAEALAHVHGLGLVHRDVKPSNVLLTLDGPRLIDFGIARALDATTVLTQSGQVFGSPGFMSPEQADGQPAGPESDVFSLGAVLAYAATGTMPFGSGVSAPVLLYRVLYEEPDLSGLAGPLHSLVRDCLAKDPSARPSPGLVRKRLDGDGASAARLGHGDWLPAALAAAVGRSAVQLLDLEGEREAGEETAAGTPVSTGGGAAAEAAQATPGAEAAPATPVAEAAPATPGAEAAPAAGPGGGASGVPGTPVAPGAPGAPRAAGVAGVPPVGAPGFGPPAPAGFGPTAGGVGGPAGSYGPGPVPPPSAPPVVPDRGPRRPRGPRRYGVPVAVLVGLLVLGGGYLLVEQLRENDRQADGSHPRQTAPAGGGTASAGPASKTPGATDDGSGPADESPTPGTTSGNPGRGAVPAKYLGTWVGERQTADGGFVTVTLTVVQSAPSEEKSKVRLETSKSGAWCEAAWTLTDADESQATYASRVTGSSPGACTVDEVDYPKIRTLSDDTLHYTLSLADPTRFMVLRKKR